MKAIGLNLLWLAPGVVGGSEEYTIRVLRALHETGEAPPVRLYARPELLATYPDLAERFAHRTIDMPGSKAARVATEHSWLAAASRHDVVVHHGGGVVPSVRSRPALVTVFDLQPLDLPHHFSRIKARWLAAMIPRSVKAARLTLCPSEFTARRVVERFGVDPDRVRVVPPGHEVVTPGVVDEATDRRLRHRFGSFLLLPAIAYAHKGHADLVRALDLLRSRHEDLSIVFTGRPGPQSEAIADLVAELDLGSRVHVLGRVPAGELDALYRSASALVFPSAYEGYGVPVAEAFARGCPVITTEAGSLPEVVGDAGLVVPVGDSQALADAVDRLATERGLASTLRERGLARIRQASWGEAGSRLARCYRDALDMAG
ncbi:MAG: glycosyltransferase family 1 protein [Actinomycetota bacterium]